MSLGQHLYECRAQPELFHQWQQIQQQQPLTEHLIQQTLLGHTTPKQLELLALST